LLQDRHPGAPLLKAGCRHGDLARRVGQLSLHLTPESRAGFVGGGKLCRRFLNQALRILHGGR